MEESAVSPPAPTYEAGPPALAPPEPTNVADSETGPSPPPPVGTESLPAVSVHNVGLHVGGGPNDSASKGPFLRAVEQQFPEFLRCYRLVSQPGESGTFGIDLQIGRQGGVPRVAQPRTGLAGDEFRACMVAAFEKVRFDAPRKPVVISYSLRFALGAGQD